MLADILNYIFASVVIMSLVVIAELLVNFKRPLLLKIMFLVIALSLLYRGVGIIYCSYNGYNRWLVDFPNGLLLFALLSFFSILYSYKLKWYIIGFGLLGIFIQFFTMLWFSYITPVDTSIALVDIPAGGQFVKVLRMLFMSVALSLSVYIFYKVLEKYNSENIYYNKLRTWSVFFIAIMSFHWIANLFKYGPGTMQVAGQIIIPVANLATLLLILFRPAFLNKTNLKMSLGDFFTKKTAAEIDEPLFMETFFTQTYYLNKEASLENLSKQLNLSPEALSGFIYSRYGSGLNDLINKHRVDYFIALVNNGKFTDYTIDALAREAGFSSRHHLYKPFKKFHGGTPSDYVRSVVE